MRAVIQRVSSATVSVEQELVGRIDRGLLVLLGVSKHDGQSDCDYIVSKLAGLRIFNDEDGKMNRDVREAAGSLLVVSQFTLYGDARKGRRPAFELAAAPEVAEHWYLQVVAGLRSGGLLVETGRFRANMQVWSINDGPVTILPDSSRAF
jgi:D-aminoacyl-tRNA deacylase